MVWQPLHVRLDNSADGPYDGIPDHLKAALWDWAAERFFEREIWGGYVLHRATMQDIGIMARLSIRTYNKDDELFTHIKHSCLNDDTHFLAVIDALLIDLALSSRTGSNDWTSICSQVTRPGPSRLTARA